MRRILACVLLFVLALAILGNSVSSQTTNNPSDELFLSDSTLAFQEKSLTASIHRDEASMQELAARLAWVSGGKELPDEVRRRTILRANNEAPDWLGKWPFREDAAPGKRNLSMAIIAIDDVNKARLNSNKQ